MGSSPYRILAIALFACLMPLQAYAHATPQTYAPEPSSVLERAPSDIRITFSERIDVSASSLVVRTPEGKVVNESVRTRTDDPYTVWVPLQDEGNGAYQVTWSVVSKDDGHFTKGAYAFAVGKGVAVPAASATSEVVQITTLPEVLGMTVELFGHGLLWATVLLFLLFVRPLLRTGAYTNETPLIRRGYLLFFALGIVLAFVGGVFQLVVKTQDLAGLQSIGFIDALMRYVQTAAGSATVVRIGAVVGMGIVCFFGHKRITESERTTSYEWITLLLLVCFAFFRAKISHATANPFFPEFSILVNFFHLIEKDIWAGILGILAITALIPRLRSFLFALIDKAFVALAITFAGVSVTATYIIWLHLKSFDNVLTTQWGSAFIQLLFAAVLLVGVRFYHLVSRRFRPELFSRFLPVTLAAEFGFALLVVYASSAIIITSPPLPNPHSFSFTAQDQGASITMARSPYEDGMVLVRVLAGSAPLVSVQPADADEATALRLEKRFDGGYVFSETFLTGTYPLTVRVTAPQKNGYDAHATFSLTKKDLAPPANTALRPFDTFTLTMLVVGLLALFLAYGAYRLARLPTEGVAHRQGVYTFAFSFIAFLVSLMGGGVVLASLSTAPLLHPYKALCEGDGNMWHMMLPSKAGVPVSATAREGCMWGMGNTMYMFPDEREYAYYRSLPHAEVTFTKPERIVAGVPVPLTFTLTEPDGTPALLFVDMEKLLHIVIVSEDQSVFAHIHADDLKPLTSEEIAKSTFTRTYAFPKGGKYLISVDYAHGVTPETKQFLVTVEGGAPQSSSVTSYPSPATFGGYSVSLNPGLPTAGKVATMRYTILKDGVPVTDILPYLSAVMHISVVKNDLSAFIHTHGEVHPPGVPLPPVIVKNGQVVHSMSSMVMKDRYSSPVDAHLIFPSGGLYTVWGEFKVGTTVIPTAFTVQVEE